jgi:hypothetical protein
VEIAVRLGLELAGSQWVQYADGRIERELVFRGRVAFLDEEREVDIHITEAPETLSAGVASRLSADFGR